MPSTLSTTKTPTMYLATTRENYQNWRRDLSAILATHPDNLLTVVTEKKLATTVELKYHKDYKSLDVTWSPAAKAEIINDLDTKAYHIMLPTIGDATTLKTIERICGNDSDAHKMLETIDAKWATAGDEDRAINKSRQRDEHLKEGAKSASLAHMTEFVEKLLELNDQTEGTDFHLKPTVLTTHVLDALSKHKPSYVDGVKGKNAGTADWRAKFDDVWDDLKKSLESMDTTAENNATNDRTDVLATNGADPRDKQIESLQKQIDTLTTILATLGHNAGDTTNLRINTRNDTKPLCNECGIEHKPNKEHGCVGMAVATGKITKEVAAKSFKWANNPLKLIDAAVENYESHQRKLGGGGSSHTLKPPKTVNLMTKASRRAWT